MSKIDKFFERFYAPVNRYVPLFDEWLLSLNPSSKVYTLCRKIGKRVPTTCYFKKKFNLSFTPCKTNPLYFYLMALKMWDTNITDAEYLTTIKTQIIL